MKVATALALHAPAEHTSRPVARVKLRRVPAGQAAASIQLADPSAQPPPSSPPTADGHAEAPVFAAVLDRVTAIATAIASPHGPSTPAANAPATAPEAETAPAAAVAANEPAAERELPMTPLEQAVHELLSRIDPSDAVPAAEPQSETPSMPAVPAVPVAAIADKAPERSAPAPQIEPAPMIARAPIAEAAMATPASHVHLVIDDGPERVVVTVAVRGDTVNVAMRASDDHTAAALARNAASLDHAIRGRGLDLAELSTRRDPDTRGRQPQHAHHHRHPDDAEPFELEEQV